MPVNKDTIINIRPKPQLVGEGLVFKTPSQSRPGLFHYTFKLDNNGWICTCDGWQNHGHCWHVTEACKVVA